LADSYTRDAQAQVTATTLRMIRSYLQDFLDRFGSQRLARSITPAEVRAWADRPSWGQSSRQAAISKIKRLFNWSVHQDYLDKSPIRSVRGPGFLARQHALTGEQVQRIIAAATPCFAELVAFIWASGCRPSEAYRMEASWIDWESGIATFRGKTTHATGKPRILYLSPAALAIAQACARLSAHERSGPLFRNSHGRPWTCYSAHHNCRQLRTKLGMGPELTLEALRHGYATDAASKVTPAVLAALMGHTGTAIVSRYYVKLDQRRDEMLAAAAMVRAKPKRQRR
jgi:integrase